MKFLEKKSFESPELLFKVSKLIQSRGIEKIQETFLKIQQAIDELTGFFDYFNFGNIDEIIEKKLGDDDEVSAKDRFLAGNESQVRPFDAMMKNMEEGPEFINPRISLVFGQTRKVAPNNSQISFK